MTEENAGRGEAGLPEVPPSAGLSGNPGTSVASLIPGKAARLGGWVRRQGWQRAAAAAAVLAAAGLLFWALAAMVGGAGPSGADGSSAPAAASPPAPASRAPLPLEGVSPLDFRLGDCFKDFDPDAPQATVVACDTGHSAQLVAIETYAPADTYPGREPLKQKALDACKQAPLTEKSAGYQLSYKLAYPSSNSWGSGDRRVDCFVTAATGNTIMESLLPAP